MHRAFFFLNQDFQDEVPRSDETDFKDCSLSPSDLNVYSTSETARLKA